MWPGHGLLEISGLALLVGKDPARPFRARERRQLSTLSLIADHRAGGELVMRDSMRACTPSRPL